ncbi:O-antigen ligase family protein [Beijerinckia indica]|uniref:O-antigen ligase-related domain-containing protein n=1 Tax=Beijerinckia indica subsp. indica (strain ATCC 9039 / DSM 1715 / NCIMB 8712) TaxID=395963 RepID=B2IJV7_BEII9|nr:O-antigen ligase family protein [Beijerinckia indica]ACB96332.1 hypothetical protein Bind_2760 [Beijerinckia indica subsp. indica ATCC 9039]
MTRILFFLGMMTIPFSGIVGLRFLGEVQHELSTYFFLAAIGSNVFFFIASSRILAAEGREIPSMKLLTVILFWTTCLIVMSFLMNAGPILTNVFNGRHAIEKFVSAFFLILYSFMLAYLTFFIAGRAWKQVICKPIAISVYLCLAFSTFELLSRHMGVATGVYAFLDRIVHGGLNPTAYANGWDPRLRSLAFEPPAFGLYAGFAWPWLIAGWVGSQGRAFVGYAIAFASLTALTLLSGNRTGLILMMGSAFVLAVLRYGYLPPHSRKAQKNISLVLTFCLTCLVVAVVIFYTANLQRYEAAVITGSSVSDLSRLASIEAAFNMSFGSPLFGIGFGEYAFHLSDSLPRWGYLSPEIQTYLEDPKSWPAAYSIFARLAAELGLVGLIMWIILWILLARSVLIASLNYQKTTGLIPSVAHPLIASCFCILLSGFTTDSLRNPMIWVTLGLCCRYLVEVRSYTTTLRQYGHFYAHKMPFGVNYYIPSERQI